MTGTVAAPDDRWARRLVCSRTGETAPLDRPAFLSPAGAPWLVEYELDAERGRLLRRRLAERPWGLWRYRELLPLRDFDHRVDLGEGGTPLVEASRALSSGLRLWLKEEAGNPTGSFKARGLSLAVNRARELGAPGVELASAGNAALALAAYAAAARLPCRVAVPDDAPATVVERCRLHGAEVVVGGADLVEARAGLASMPGDHWDLSTLREPYRVEGKKTLGLELAERLGWSLPDWIVYPTGGGTGIIGMHKAFDELERLGLIAADARPRFAVVQMRGCAPIVDAFERGLESAPEWPRPETRVWGLRVPVALGDFLILGALRGSGGAAVAVAEEAVAGVERRLAADCGLLVGPEGAAAIAGLERLLEQGRVRENDRVVVFQTGHPHNYR